MAEEQNVMTMQKWIDITEEQNVMTMQKWIDITDKLISFRDKKILKNSGKISHNQAIKKAEDEYEKFRIK